MILHVHTTREQILEIARPFCRLHYSTAGDQAAVVPAWLTLLYDHSAIKEPADVRSLKHRLLWRHRPGEWK